MRLLRTYKYFCVRFCTAFAQCMWLCVGCTDFAYICVRIWAMHAALHTYKALRRLYGVCALSGLYVHIQILRFKRLVPLDTAYQFLWHIGDSVFWIRRFVQRSDDLILRFIDFFNVCATVVIDRPEDPSKGCDLQGSFAEDLYVLIGPSYGSVLWVPLRYYFDVLHIIHRPYLTSDRLLLRNTITRCSNITAHYAASV